MVMNLENLDTACEKSLEVLDEEVSFNPAHRGSIDTLLSLYGPEQVYFMGKLLMQSAREDVDTSSKF